MPSVWAEVKPAGDVDLNWAGSAVSASGSVILAYDYPRRLWLSTNSGATWAEMRPAGDVDKAWSCVAASGDGSVLIAGVYFGRLYLSTNGGTSWSEITPAGNFDKAWSAVSCDYDGSVILAAVYNGRAYLSTNSGAGWAETYPAGAANKYWKSCACDSDGSVLLFGAGYGRLYLSSNGGTNWAEQQPAGALNAYWYNCAVDSDGSTLVAGAYIGRLWISSDGGANWAETRPAGDADFHWDGFACGSDGSTLVAGINDPTGRLYSSINAGTNWAEEQPDGDVDKSWLCFVCNSDGTVLVAGAARLYVRTEVAPGPEIPVCELNLTGYAPSQNVVSIPLAVLSLTNYIPSLSLASVPLAELVLEGFAPYRYNDIPLAELNLAAYAPGYGISGVYIPIAADLLLTKFAPAYVWNLPPSAYPAAQTIYTCTLTGSNESPPLDDIVLPMSSFQSRLRDGDPSYVACVIPVSTQYAALISARQNGEIIIKKGYRLLDGTVQLEEIARVNFEYLTTDTGARNDTASIVGHKTTTSTAPKERILSGISYRGLQANGKRRIRAEVDLFLRVGDTVLFLIDGTYESFIVGYISYTVNTNYAVMEVTEA